MNEKELPLIQTELVPGKTGIFLIDKPTGWTSHDVVNVVRKKTQQKKVGHAGTLDPLATGLLIVLVGKQFTKQQDMFMKQDKSYQVTAQLGITTDSYDSDGQVTAEHDWSKVELITADAIKQLLPVFMGTQLQTVPAFSAVKIKGKKLYELARQDKLQNNVILPQRQVEIFTLQLTNFDVQKKNQKAFFSLEVSCGSGTYIRSLIYDIGQQLGVGATVTALRRTRIGELQVEQALSLE